MKHKCDFHAACTVNSEALSAVRLTELYERWHAELCNNGFNLWKYSENRVLRSGVIEYYHDSNFSVKGDHAYDIPRIFATLSPTGIKLEYHSSNLMYGYLEAGGWATIEEREQGVLEVKAFIKKHKMLFDDLHEEIKVSEEGAIELCVGDNSLQRDLGKLEKLAVLLDRELARQYPFKSIRDYETIARRTLSGVRDDFESASHTEFKYFESRDLVSLRNLVIISSYNITKPEAISAFRELAEMLAECARSVESNEAEFFDKREFNYILNELEQMTADDFCALKDELFDI